MSLQTDSIFVQALSWSPYGEQSVLEMLHGHVYGTAIPLPDEDLDNTPPPYVIVGFQSLTNSGISKDNPYEGDTDEVRISVTVAASTLDELHRLTVIVRKRIGDFFVQSDDPLTPSGYQFTADSINYDSSKPCYWQQLYYDCDTLVDFRL